IKWPKGILNSNRVIGDIYFKCPKNYAKAFDFYQLNVALSKKNGDIVNQAKGLETIAKQYGVINQHQKSLEKYAEEILLNPGIGIKTTIYGNMGVSYNAIGDYSHALTYYDSALQLLDSKAKFKNIDPQDTIERAVIYLNKGDLYMALSKPDNAFDEYQKVLSSAASAKEKQFQIWGLTGIGKAYKMKKNYEKAIENYQSAKKVCDEIIDFEDEVKIDGELAN